MKRFILITMINLNVLMQINAMQQNDISAVLQSYQNDSVSFDAAKFVVQVAEKDNLWEIQALSRIANVKDDCNNGFLHIAVKKEDVDSVRYFSSKFPAFLSIQNMFGKTPVDIGIEKLITAEDKNRAERGILLDTMLKNILPIMVGSEQWGKETLQKISTQLCFYPYASKVLNTTVNSLRSMCGWSSIPQKDECAFVKMLIELSQPKALYEFLSDNKNRPDKKSSLLESSVLALQKCNRRDKQYEHNKTSEMENERNNARCCQYIIFSYLKNTLKMSVMSLPLCCSLHQF